MIRYCKQCKKEFKPTNGNVRKGRGIYCCPECYWISLKGKKPSKESLIKRSKALKGIKHSREWVEKIANANRGRKASIETRIKLSIAHLGHTPWNKKDGKTSPAKKIKNSVNYRLWREGVYRRDDWTCQKCKTRGKKLHSHHIQNFSQYSNLRFVVENGITLCENCHNHFHKKYGFTSNTKEQLEKFLIGDEKMKLELKMVVD